jgi:dolichol-phosphate mannosyltransferase
VFIHCHNPYGGADLASLEPILSIVAPCFNEAEGITEFARRATIAARNVVGEEFELVLVDDGSQDQTWNKIACICDSDSRITGIKLSRNFGHQAALTAGLCAARGKRILMIDADLQDPPEILGQMMMQIDAGADVVYGRRSRRKGETAFKIATASAFYRVINWISEIDIPRDTGDFRLVTRRVLDVLLSMPERARFVRGMMGWIGFRQEPCFYVRDARHAGTTKYPLRKMLRFAADAITGFSTIPLRLSHFVANISLLISMATLVYVIWSLIIGRAIPGWASLLGITSLFSGAQMFMLGVIGSYVGRTYIEAKGRPLFVVAERSPTWNPTITDGEIASVQP